jgi:hypothetical protein
MDVDDVRPRLRGLRECARGRSGCDGPQKRAARKMVGLHDLIMHGRQQPLALLVPGLLLSAAPPAVDAIAGQSGNAVA